LKLQFYGSLENALIDTRLLIVGVLWKVLDVAYSAPVGSDADGHLEQIAALIDLKLILDQLDRFERRLRHALALKTSQRMENV
jgi:hypothetical protein